MQARRKPFRRSSFAGMLVVFFGLVLTGGGYAAATTTIAPITNSATSAEEGRKLFLANCATCHGTNGEGTSTYRMGLSSEDSYAQQIGPSLIGVGAASVDFQVGTGRMPGQASGPQLMKKPVQFTDDQILAMANYVASLAPGPSIPAAKYLEATGDVTHGGELFRINCAMCHSAAGAGGALTEGKWAPALNDIEAKHVYEAMVTGPQNMPVFNDSNLTPEDKQDIITYLYYMDNNSSVGGFELGSIGPVAEGIFIWIFGLGLIIAITVWLGAKSN